LVFSMIPIQVTGANGDSLASGTAPQEVGRYLRAGTLQLSTLPPLSLYVHLPWCLKKCPYCDFNSHEIGSGGVPEQHYLNALMADLETSLPLIWGRGVQTVFIGGGTPSLFSPDAIDQLIAGIRARLRLAPNAEITLEANPGTFETNRFRAYRAGGVTRLSVGVQSFEDDFLQALGRVHSRDQALAALTEAAQVFETFNLDLMYALPGQDLARLRKDVQTALSFSPKHLSVYHLTIEPNTYFAKYPPAAVEDDLAADMLDLITDMTGVAGLQRYEVSAYAQAGHHSAHNTNYWRFGDYLGIGAGAHSKLSFAHRVVRQVRVRNPQTYMAQALLGHCLVQDDDVKRAELPFEFMLNALRLANGFDLSLFSERTGMPVSALQAGLDKAQLMRLIVREGNHITPTGRGFDFLNDLQALFLPT
jgi:oxygen-independent coproporphyrinogen-3 oxidase